MKDFGQWFGESAKAAAKPPEAEGQLPEGVYELDGKLYIDCSSCGRRCEVEDLEYTPNCGDRHYCGGSPHCLP